MISKKIRHNLTKAPVIRPVLSWLYHRALAPDDIFIASYPRAGSTWFRFLLYELLTGEKTSFGMVNRAIPGVGHHFSAPKLVAGARLIQTHEPYRRAYGRAIYLVRDVRDVVISEYHFQQLWRVYDGTFAAFVADFLAGSVNRYGTWANHTNTWLDAHDAAPDRILMIRFSELRHDTRAVLERSLDFLGLSGGDEAIDQAIANNQADRMRAKEGELKFTASEQRFVRQGKVGGWQQTLSAEQVERIERATADVLRRLEYLGAQQTTEDADGA
jgi:hypothetical protein